MVPTLSRRFLVNDTLVMDILVTGHFGNEEISIPICYHDVVNRDPVRGRKHFTRPGWIHDILVKDILVMDILVTYILVIGHFGDETFW